MIDSSEYDSNSGIPIVYENNSIEEKSEREVKCPKCYGLGEDKQERPCDECWGDGTLLIESL